MKSSEKVTLPETSLCLSMLKSKIHVAKIAPDELGKMKLDYSWKYVPKAAKEATAGNAKAQHVPV